MGGYFRWGDDILNISSDALRMVKDLALTITKRKKVGDADGAHYAMSDGREPAVIELSVRIDRRWGVTDVAREVKHWIEVSRGDHKEPITIGGVDLFGTVFALFSCEVTEIYQLRDGTWVWADVALTFEESTRGSVTYESDKASSYGSGGGGGGGSGKKSTKDDSSTAKLNVGVVGIAVGATVANQHALVANNKKASGSSRVFINEPS